MSRDFDFTRKVYSVASVSPLSGQARSSELPMFSSSVRVKKHLHITEKEKLTWAHMQSSCLCVVFLDRLSLAHTISWVIQVWVPHTCERHREELERQQTVRNHLTSYHSHVPKQSVQNVGLPLLLFLFRLVWESYRGHIKWMEQQACQSVQDGVCSKEGFLFRCLQRKWPECPLCYIDLWNMYGKNVHMYIYIYDNSSWQTYDEHYPHLKNAEMK